MEEQSMKGALANIHAKVHEVQKRAGIKISDLADALKKHEIAIREVIIEEVSLFAEKRIELDEDLDMEIVHQIADKAVYNVTYEYLVDAERNITFDESLGLLSDQLISIVGMVTNDNEINDYRKRTLEIKDRSFDLEREKKDRVIEIKNKMSDAREKQIEINENAKELNKNQTEKKFKKLNVLISKYEQFYESGGGNPYQLKLDTQRKNFQPAGEGKQYANRKFARSNSNVIRFNLGNDRNRL